MKFFDIECVFEHIFPLLCRLRVKIYIMINWSLKQKLLIFDCVCYLISALKWMHIVLNLQASKTLNL